MTPDERQQLLNAGTNWIYVIGSFEHLNAVKIGMSRKPVRLGRLKQLQTGFPYHLHVYAEFPVYRHRVDVQERNIHKTLKKYRMKGEWFNIHPKIAIEKVKEVLEQ